MKRAGLPSLLPLGSWLVSGCSATTVLSSLWPESALPRRKCGVLRRVMSEKRERFTCGVETHVAHASEKGMDDDTVRVLSQTTRRVS